MNKVFVTRIIPEKGLEMLRQSCEVELWQDELPPAYEILREAAGRVDGLLCLLTDKIDADLLGHTPNLKVVSQMAVGVDNIDLAAATVQGIPVGHTPGVLTEATADFAFTLLVAAARRISEAERFVRAGKWRTWGPTLFMGQDLFGATLGIIGMGRIGQAVARRARGFDMRILYSNPSPVELPADLHAEARSFEEVLAESDFISLHTPLTPKTRHLIDARALGMMKKSCVLINTARGPVVDAQALYQALVDGQIAYAALDVTDPEPIPPDSPLLQLENCLIVPHIASSSLATRTRMATMAAENLLAGLAGQRLPHCANPDVYAAR